MSAQKRSASVTTRHLGGRAGRYCPAAYASLRRHRRTAARDRLLHARGTHAHDLAGVRPPDDDRPPARRRRGGPRRGRHVRRGRAARAAAGRAGAAARGQLDARLVLAPARRSSTCSRAPRPACPRSATTARWAFESAAVDLALRQAGRSLADVLGREPQPINFVVSLRLGDPPSTEPVTRRLAAYPGLQFKLDYSPAWDDGPARDARRDRRRRVGRLQGRLQGHAGRRRDRCPSVYRARRRDVPGRLARGPRPDRPGGRRGAAAAPRPDHLGRADPRRRRTSRRCRSCRGRSTSSRRGSAPGASCCTRTSGAPSAASRTTAAGSPSSASGAARSSTSRRCSMAARRTTSRRRATTGRSSRENGLPANPLPPDIEPTGFRRRS